ncbi:MAG: hypothetical protein KGL46_02040 [Hyphomicrobiales bacterium]|nr:hypothetical protein [Hyphomicrobiales bacterium]
MRFVRLSASEPVLRRAALDPRLAGLRERAALSGRISYVYGASRHADDRLEAAMAAVASGLGFDGEGGALRVRARAADAAGADALAGAFSDAVRAEWTAAALRADALGAPAARLEEAARSAPAPEPRSPAFLGALGAGWLAALAIAAARLRPARVKLAHPDPA